MCPKELSDDEREQLKLGKSSAELDVDRTEDIKEGRKSKVSADAATKAALKLGKGIYSAIGEGRIADSNAFDLAETPSGVATKLNSKALEADFRLGAVLASDTYFISCSSREVIMNSLLKQGTPINKTDLTAVVGTPGERTRFNSFNTNKTSKYYASGSHLTNGGGPRIQGPGGDDGSCKFIIIQRA
tara:strand:+ start:200 stop:760 length:561 start_codon:yes stop_codon:yes gene_type:complete